jgi:hypothetical protein
VAELGGHEVTLLAMNSAGAAITEVSAGAPVTGARERLPAARAVLPGRVAGAPPRIRHAHLSRAERPGWRCAPSARRQQRLQIDWRFKANFGRGHYGVSCAILDERQRWVAVSAPVLLTVNERASEQALVYLEGRARCGPMPRERPVPA